MLGLTMGDNDSDPTMHQGAAPGSGDAGEVADTTLPGTRPPPPRMTLAPADLPAESMRLPDGALHVAGKRLEDVRRTAGSVRLVGRNVRRGKNNYRGPR